jgi:hypothetical protein
VDQPRLSVVIPYYRGADSIAEAVASVRAQTLPADEIVIVDDGSPDDLEAALGETAAGIKIVHKPNGGISSAMNAATEAASGDFLVQLDQDDVFMPGRLAAVAAAATANPAAEVIATDAIVEFDGAEVARIGSLSPLEVPDPRAAILRRCYILWPAIRRSRLLAIGGYDESFPVMQDWDCFIRLLVAGAPVAVVPEPLYRWRLTPGSRSSADGVENAEALIRLMEKTAQNPDLTVAERELVAENLLSQERRMALEQAHLAVETGAGDARRRSLKVVTGAGFSASSRVKAAAAVVSPALASRFIEARAARDPGAEALARRGFGRSTDSIRERSNLEETA